MRLIPEVIGVGSSSSADNNPSGPTTSAPSLRARATRPRPSSASVNLTADTLSCALTAFPHKSVHRTPDSPDIGHFSQHFAGVGVDEVAVVVDQP